MVLKVLKVLILYQLITDDSAFPKLPKLLKLSKLPIFAPHILPRHDLINQHIVLGGR